MELIRSTYFPPEIKGGTRLFLNFDGEKYIVTSRFERFMRTTSLDRAIARFEALVAGRVS